MTDNWTYILSHLTPSPSSRNFETLKANAMELTWQSPAPTRAKIQSRTEMLALSQGTKEPTCAIRMFTPTCKHDKN